MITGCRFDVVVEFKRGVYEMALTELARFLPRHEQRNRYLRSGMRSREGEGLPSGMPMHRAGSLLVSPGMEMPRVPASTPTLKEQSHLAPFGTGSWHSSVAFAVPAQIGLTRRRLLLKEKAARKAMTVRQAFASTMLSRCTISGSATYPNNRSNSAEGLRHSNRASALA